MRVAPPVVLASALLLSAIAPESSAQPAYTSGLSVNCQGVNPSNPPPSTPPPPCVITIIVPANCGSGIHVQPDPIVVRAGDRVRIRWSITGQWQFDDANGIFVHMDTEKSFREYTRATDGQSFAVDFLSPKRATYKYDINLKKGTQVCRIDPVIVNW
jgi:hypothetical protein